jgi:WD repeat-containing protein 35
LNLFFAGFTDAALKTALHLQQYEGILDTETIYCIIALASCSNRAFGTCSKAFIRLEALDEASFFYKENISFYSRELSSSLKLKKIDLF